MPDTLTDTPPTTVAGPAASALPAVPALASQLPREIGGPQGPEPTRYGDWEKSGRCIDF